jgi:hypothetical protein
MKNGIAELRTKGASYATVADILRNVNVPVACDTVFRFCHEVLGEPMTRRRRKRKMPAIVPKERAREKSLIENARDTGNLQGKLDNQPAAGWVRSTGPHIADPNTI